MTVHYRHAQFGTLQVMLLGGAALVVLAVIAVKGWHPALGVALAILVPALLLFWRLVVEVDPRGVRLRFGIGLIHREFPLAEIGSVEAVRNRWYYGWGIRLTPHGWLFNVSGLEAVEIALASGRRYRIGTDEPRALAAAIRGALEDSGADT
jgi:hypothetical protein